MPKKRIWIYALLFSAVSVNYIDRIALSVAAKPIATAYHLSPVEMGYLFSAFLWTYFLAAIPWGLAVDRWGTRRASAAGMVWWSLATVATGLLGWSYGTILATRLAMGLGESSTYPASERVIREWIPARERGLATVIFNSGGYAGPAVGSLVVGFIASLYGWRAGFVVVGIVGLIWTLVWLSWFRQPEVSPFISETERAYILAERGNPAGHGPASSFAALVASRSVWGIAVTQGCIIYTLYMLLTWMPTYLESTGHLSILHTGLYTAIPYAVAAPCSILLGYVSDRLLRREDVGLGGRRRAVITMLLLSAVITLVPLASQTWAVLALFTVSMVCIASAAGLNLALLGDLLRSEADAGRATGLQLAAATMFGLLSPIVTGYVVAGTGSYNGAFVLDGAMLVLGALACFVMTRKPIPTITAGLPVPAAASLGKAG